MPQANLPAMTLAEVIADEELRRREFPVAGERIFLAHAGDCPLPRRVAEAISNYAQQSTRGDQEALIYPLILNQGRRLGAQLLHCEPEEVAFVGPTSLALSFIAGGLQFAPGKNIVGYFDDYPSNVYPWKALEERGLELRWIKACGLGAIEPADVMDQVDDATALVALATCHFISGYRIDYEAIGAALRQRNVLFCLDAIQTLGAFPTTMANVDLLAADAHKWLLGPCGAGIMCVRRSLQPSLTPTIYGWHNVRCPNYVAQEKLIFRNGAQKYEAGTHNLLGIVGLVAAMELLLDLGIENIAAELLRKRAWLAPALQEKGYIVLQSDAPPQAASCILSLSRPGSDLTALHQRLLDANIITSLRTDRSGQKYIRLSPHFYNTDAELERLLGLL